MLLWIRVILLSNYCFLYCYGTSENEDLNANVGETIKIKCPSSSLNENSEVYWWWALVSALLILCGFYEAICN